MHDLSQKYDLVHVHSVPDFLVFAALFPRLRGVPVILDIRDILPEFYASKFGVSERSIGFRFLCLVERLCARFASHVIVASHTWRERLLSRSVKAGQCTLVLNVPDRSIFVQSERKKDAKDRVLLLYHGTFNQHQGLDVAVRAFAKIKDLAPDAEFHVYGDGPSKSELGSLISQLHLEVLAVLLFAHAIDAFGRIASDTVIGPLQRWLVYQTRQRQDRSFRVSLRSLCYLQQSR